VKLHSPVPDPDARLRNETLEWFLRRSGEGWSADDEDAFAAWLDADPAHRRAFARWESHWRALDKLPAEAVARLRASPPESPGAAVEHGSESRVRGGWRPPDPAPEPPPRRRLLVMGLVMGLAAGIAALGIGAGTFLYYHQYVEPLYREVFATPRGGSLSASLPDGTGIELDTATRLQVTYHRARRLIALHEGQALFSVQPNPDRPFIVTAGAARVQVVGTRFSVRHTPRIPGDPGVAVAVDEGRVQVAPARGLPAGWLDALGGGPDGMLVTAGERMVTGADGTPESVAPLSAAGAAPWRNHRVSFVDTPLALALAELERYGDTGLAITDPEVARLRLSGTFDPRDGDTFRRILPRALPIRLEDRNGLTEILAAR
jgi:transmembrane sensor